MIIAMHEGRRLRQRRFAQRSERPVEQLAVARDGLARQVPAEEPLREQFHLAQQKSAVVGRQAARRCSARRLHGHQRRERIGVQPVDVAPCRELVEILAGSQVREQQESAGGVARQDDGDVQAHGGEGLRHLHERCDVFLVRRRVHDDVRIGAASQAEIAAKARIRRGGFDPGARKSEVLDHPASERREAGIACIRGNHA